MEMLVNGVNLHYELHGHSGPRVLLLHGWGCSTKHFDPIVQELEKTHQLCVIDFPAHGLSARPPEPWGVSDFCKCVRELIVNLQFTPCDIIAHSFGGRIAIKLSAEYPELVRRLVLTGCAGLRSEKTPEQLKRERAFKQKKVFLQKLSRIVLFEKLASRLLHTMQLKYGSADYNALDDEMKKTFVKVISEDLRPLLPDIKASTLLIWGEKDTATPLWMGQTMEKEITDAGLVVFENDDHYAYLRQWPRFTAIVKAFLT